MRSLLGSRVLPAAAATMMCTTRGSKPDGLRAVVNVVIAGESSRPMRRFLEIVPLMELFFEIAIDWITKPVLFGRDFAKLRTWAISANKSKPMRPDRVKLPEMPAASNRIRYPIRLPQISICARSNRRTSGSYRFAWLKPFQAVPCNVWQD